MELITAFLGLAIVLTGAFVTILFFWRKGIRQVCTRRGGGPRIFRVLQLFTLLFALVLIAISGRLTIGVASAARGGTLYLHHIGLTEALPFSRKAENHVTELFNATKSKIQLSNEIGDSCTPTKQPDGLKFNNGEPIPYQAPTDPQGNILFEPLNTFGSGYIVSHSDGADVTTTVDDETVVYDKGEYFLCTSLLSISSPTTVNYIQVLSGPMFNIFGTAVALFYFFMVISYAAIKQPFNRNVPRLLTQLALAIVIITTVSGAIWHYSDMALSNAANGGTWTSFIPEPAIVVPILLYALSRVIKYGTTLAENDELTV